MSGNRRVGAGRKHMRMLSAADRPIFACAAVPLPLLNTPLHLIVVDDRQTASKRLAFPSHRKKVIFL